MENFKEIAEKCLKGELQGIFILADDTRLISDRVGKSPIKGHFHFDCIDGIFDKFGFCKGFYDRKNIPEYNIVDFIPFEDMETKEIKIEVPKGYEIDKENSSFERIIFKKKKKYPESWEEYYDGDPYKSIDVDAGMHNYETITRKLESYTKLLVLRRNWIHIWSQEQGIEKDWEPDWTDRRFCKFCIVCHENKLVIEAWSTVTFSLAFPTKELAENFIKNFKDLLEQAKGLY